MSAITLLDGGMGQELIHRAGDNPTPLWSTQVMVDHPGMVRDIHADFFAAGATIATTNTYAIHHDRLAKTALKDQFSVLHMAALSEATTARLAHGSGRIAGSIGPLSASYRPDLHPPKKQAVAAYSEIAALLAPVVDLIICETVASCAHADAILDAAATTGKPIWLAVTVDDTDGSKLRSGEAVSDVVSVAKGRASAILANCSTPEVIPAALVEFTAADMPFGAYANGFTKIADGFLEEDPTVDALTLRRDFTPDMYAAHALKWVEQGATIIGGCCEVGPAHIAAIKHALEDAGHTIA